MREQGEGDDKAFLIVEDNPVTLRAYARFFGRYAPIITAVSAREACAALQENRVFGVNYFFLSTTTIAAGCRGLG